MRKVVKSVTNISVIVIFQLSFSDILQGTHIAPQQESNLTHCIVDTFFPTASLPRQGASILSEKSHYHWHKKC